jgi:protein TonB
MQRGNQFFFTSGIVSFLIHALFFAFLVGGALILPRARRASLQMEIVGTQTKQVSHSVPHSPRKTLPPQPVSIPQAARNSVQTSAPSMSAQPQSGVTGDLPAVVEDFQVTQMPILQDEVRIPYPGDSRTKGIQGAVVMDLLVDDLGRVRDAQLIEGPAEDLDAAALSAVKRFHFKPAYVHDQPVSVRIRYAYRFVIER